MAEESGDKGAARKEPMIDQSNRPSAIDFESEISKMKVSDLSALVGAHIEVLKSEKEILKGEKEKEVRKPEKEFSKPEKEAFKGEKEKEIRKPEKEYSKPEKESFKGEKEKEVFKPEGLKPEGLKPEGLKPEDKPIDFNIERITEVVLERVMMELQRRGQLR